MALTIQNTEIANYLLDIQAVKINVKDPFTWTSGIKSPIYCDCRIINSFVKERDAVIAGFTDLINEKYISETNIICGVASGGISYGALIADRLKLPFIYVRSEKKKHGLGKQVEGSYEAFGNKVVVIEDLISTGGSSMKAINALKDEAMEIVCLLSIMTYGFTEADEAFDEAGIYHDSLCNLDAIIDVAAQRNLITSHDIDKVHKFKASPKNWESC